MGERALKLFVVLLCCINAAVWLFYTESTLMGFAWGGVAIGMLVWIMKDVRR